MFPGPAFSLSGVNAHCLALEEKVHPTGNSSCLAVPCQVLKSQEKEKKGKSFMIYILLGFQGGWRSTRKPWRRWGGCWLPNSVWFWWLLRTPLLRCLLTPSKSCCNAVQHRYHCSSYLWDKTVWKLQKEHWFWKKKSKAKALSPSALWAKRHRYFLCLGFTMHACDILN